MNYARSIAGEFLKEAFRGDSITISLWDRYENRIRQRRIDEGLGLIEPPRADPSQESELGRQETEARSQNGEGVRIATLTASTIKVRTLKVDTLIVKDLKVGQR
ncbi:MAG: hypothetical protein ACREDR_08910 [Blastocatellia bacterium]